MTDQEINEAIAEACGWEKCTCLDEHCGAWFKPDSDDPQLGVQNYCNDLNAMHEAESLIADGDDKHKYASLIGRHDTWNLLHATARQRSEAFLRTIGKWRDA